MSLSLNNQIEVSNLSHSYGATSILNQLDLSLGSGESMAIMGPSGTGKSTLLNCLAGLEKIQTGNVVVLGKKFEKLDEEERAELRRTEMGIIFQFFHLLPTLSTFENVELPLVIQGVKKKQREKKVGELIESVGLSHRSNALPETLSGGERQRAAIARALVHEPTIIFADEPTGNLDESTSGGILELLQDIIKDKNMTCVMVTHSQSAASICDRKFSLHNGRLEENTKPSLK